MKRENFPYHIVNDPDPKVAGTYNDGELQAENQRRAENTVKDEAGNAVPAPQATLVPVRSQTFVINEFETVEEFVTHPATDEVKLDIVNRAVRLKQQVAAKRLIESDKFELTEGPYDMFDSISAVVERRAASPQDKIASALDKLPTDERIALLERLLAAQTGVAASA